MIDALYARYFEIARKHSNKTAVDTPDGKLSFRKLDDLSDKIGSYLSASNVKACELFMHPSYIYFASLVACMKTGTVAIPADPSQTDAQLIRNKKRLSSDLCLTSPELLTRAEGIFNSVQCISVESLPEKYQSLKKPDIADSNLFPIHRIFTSGTTGIKKLVSISRESVYVHAIEAAEIYRYKTGSVVANLGRHSSTSSINGFWRVILSGSCFMCFDLKKESFADIKSRIRNNGVSNLQGPTSVMFKLLKAANKTDTFSDVNHLVFGGEPLNPAFFQNIEKYFRPECLITLNYSSTETLLISAYTDVLSEIKKFDKIPVGVPAPSKKVQLLDDYGKEVNKGEAGEVVVTSKYIALNISGSDNKQKKLITNEDSNLRSYFTGDLARWNQNGLLEHLGRKDSMLKINGVRIDTKLIENQLMKIMAIENAVVVPYEISNKNKQLIACIVKNNDKISDSEIIRILSRELDTSHLPVQYVHLDKIPVNLRGKTDYKKLLEICRDFFQNPGQAKKSSSEDYLDIKKYLISEWSKILKKPINKHTYSFFSAGGDSLSISELVIAINSTYNLNLESSWVFEYPTINSQAEFLNSVFSENKTGEHTFELNKSDLSKDEIRRLLGW